MKVDYSDISRTYDRYRSYPDKLIRRMIEFGQIAEGNRLLDLGCGTGNVSQKLLESMGLDVIGLDRSLPMLKIARQKDMTVVYADIEAGLPLGSSSFNVVVAAYVIQHITNLTALFVECWRVIREGALLLLTSSHKQIENQHPVIREFFPSCIGVEKARFPDIPELADMLGRAGFKDISQEEVRVEGIPIDSRYLEQVKNKFVSTYHILSDREFEQGVNRLQQFINSREKPEYREWRGTLMRGMKKS